jgi:hypothetical protein
MYVRVPEPGTNIFVKLTERGRSKILRITGHYREEW